MTFFCFVQPQHHLTGDRSSFHPSVSSTNNGSTECTCLCKFATYIFLKLYNLLISLTAFATLTSPYLPATANHVGRRFILPATGLRPQFTNYASSPLHPCRSQCRLPCFIQKT